MFTSSLGSFDSGLGATLELGGPDSLVEQQFYAPLVLINGEISELPVADALSIPGQVTNVFLTENTAIYVDVAGDDENGDGSMNSPYATIFRAAEDYRNFVPGEFDIAINLSEGVHEVTRTFDEAYNFGAKLSWVGQAETIATPTISNIDASVTAGSAPYTALEFLDFDLDLSAATSGPEVGQFVRLTGCTGGTNPQGLNGLHEIVAEAAGVATCRVWRDGGTTELPSGAITVASARLIKTVLHFTADDHGINMLGPFDMGDWSGVVIRGNDDAVASSKRALRLFNTAGFRSSTVSAVDGAYFYEWAVAIEAVGGGVAYMLRCGAAKMTSNCFTAGSAASILARDASFNGVAGVTLQASGNSTIDAIGAAIQSVGGSGAGVPVLAQTGGFIDVSSATIHYDQGSGTAILARDIGRVHAASSTLVGFTTDYTPTVNTLGADGSYINIV